MGSGMTPVMFPGIQHYMSQMGMGIGGPSLPSIHNPMPLPKLSHAQAMSVTQPQMPNQNLMCQNPVLGAFNYQNQMQNPCLSDQYARYIGYQLLHSASQVNLNSIFHFVLACKNWFYTTCMLRKI